MRFEFCLAVLSASLVVLAVGSNDDDDNNPNFMAVGGRILHLKHHMNKRNWNGDIMEKRSKRSLSDSERNAVLSEFNAQRGSVGASDMNYVGYDVALEAGLDYWTSGCNSDAPVSLPNDTRVIKFNGIIYPDPKVAMQLVFNLSSAFYSVRSVYVTGAAASVKFCQTLIIEGKQYNNQYLTIYGITTKTDLFDGTVQQYTLGEACTRCQSNVTWCYNNLCRADCSFSISGCCQISNGKQTSVCASTNISTTTTTATTATTTTATTTTAAATTAETRFQSPYFKNDRSGAPEIQVFGTSILHGFLLSICYYFQ